MGSRALIAAVVSLCALTGARAAQKPIDSYIARLSAEDHFNSNGDRLTNAAAIIRQDRANFYAGKSDEEDQGDDFFDSKANRARMESMLRNGQASSRVLRTIVDKNPLVEVRIYKDGVEVEILK